MAQKIKLTFQSILDDCCTGWCLSWTHVFCVIKFKYQILIIFILKFNASWRGGAGWFHMQKCVYFLIYLCWTARLRDVDTATPAEVSGPIFCHALRCSLYTKKIAHWPTSSCHSRYPLATIGTFHIHDSPDAPCITMRNLTNEKKY